MDSRCCAYSYLNEDSAMCDYEIATDQLASMISVAKHSIKHIDKKELEHLIELVYHANGSIRGKLAITEEDLSWVASLYDKYNQELKMFVLPDGCIGASHLHVLRSNCKQIVRLIVLIQKEGITVNELIYNLFNLLSNTFFQMALYENRLENIPEVEFKSKSYGC